MKWFVTCASLATLIAVTPGLADPSIHRSIHTPPHRSLMRQHLNPWNINAPLNTQQQVRRTRQQHRP
jgi:hypothetical protein